MTTAKTNSTLSEKLIVVGVLLAAGAGIFTIGKLTYNRLVSETVTVEITGKENVTRGDSSKYLIYTKPCMGENCVIDIGLMPGESRQIPSCDSKGQPTTVTMQPDGSTRTSVCVKSTAGIETFQNTDSWYPWKWNSSDLYGKLDKGMTCTLRVNGTRFPFLRWYRNIVQADCYDQKPKAEKVSALATAERLAFAVQAEIRTISRSGHLDHLKSVSGSN